jgi:hypothetical protein
VSKIYGTAKRFFYLFCVVWQGAEVKHERLPADTCDAFG